MANFWSIIKASPRLRIMLFCCTDYENQGRLTRKCISLQKDRDKLFSDITWCIVFNIKQKKYSVKPKYYYFIATMSCWDLFTFNWLFSVCQLFEFPCPIFFSESSGTILTRSGTHDPKSMCFHGCTILVFSQKLTTISMCTIKVHIVINYVAQ